MRLWPFLLLLAAVMTGLRAQDEPVHMRPEFPLIFPLDQNGKDVTVKYPVMINPGTVLKPGMQLRVLYVLSADAGGSSDLTLAHQGTIEQSYARNAFGGGNGDTAKLPPQLAHEIEGYRRTVWEVANNFVLAMAQYPTDSMHLIYSPTGKTQDMHDERFSFFDGLFVGQPNGKVTVIAVEKQSKADAAGIKAGDEIVAVGSLPTRDDLATFATAFVTARKAAIGNDLADYTMTIRSAEGEKAVNLALPPRIKSGLMDDFLGQPPPRPPATNAIAPNGTSGQ